MTLREKVRAILVAVEDRDAAAELVIDVMARALSEEEAQRRAPARDKKRRQRSACPPPCPGTVPGTVPPLVPGQSEGHGGDSASPQEEDPDLDLVSEEDPDPDPDSCAEPTPEPPILTFPTVAGARNKTREWHLTQKALDLFRTGFPDLDVLSECRQALVWCEANRAKRKTPDGMLAFLNGWLKRAQNGGGKRLEARAPPKRPGFCAFHAHPGTSGRKAFSADLANCSECRHMWARDNRRESEPLPMGDTA